MRLTMILQLLHLAPVVSVPSLPPPARRICRPGPISPAPTQSNQQVVSPPNCVTKLNFRYNGTRVGKPASGGTADGCCAMCASVGACRHWGWHPVGQAGQPTICYLYNDDGTFTESPPNNGFIAGSVTNHNKMLKNVLIIGDSISLGAMGDLTMFLAGIATVEHGPYSSDGGALDTKYAMNTNYAMVGANSGPPWINPAKLPSGDNRYGDGCLNATFLVSSTQLPIKYDVISFNFGVHDVDYSGYHEEYVPAELYETNIRAIKKTLQATGGSLSHSHILFYFCFVLFLFFFLICIMYFTVLIKFYFAIARLCLLQPDGVTFDNIRNIVRETSAKDSLESRITKKARIIAGILDMDQGSTHFCGYLWRVCEQNCLTRLHVHFNTRWGYPARRSSRGNA